MSDATCDVCPLECSLGEGAVGRCGVRANSGGSVVLKTYGHVTTLVAGPIEQKPFFHFSPGMRVLSVGSSGCNMTCGFCQNYEISQTGKARGVKMEPRDIVASARKHGASGVAFTFSEPIVWKEYVVDAAVACREAGLATIMKTNGFASARAFRSICEHMDAVNIDLKGDAESYRDVCGVDMSDDPNGWPVIRSMNIAASMCHLEVSLISIPGRDKELPRILSAMAFATDRDTPIHVLRFVPDFAMRHSPPATPEHVSLVAAAARKEFRYVYENSPGSSTDTRCECGQVVVLRKGVVVQEVNLTHDGACSRCGLGQHVKMRGLKS